MDLVTLDETSYLSCFLPEQFYPEPSAAPECFEVALMRAVLEDALHCLLKSWVINNRQSQYLGLEAEKWLFSNDEDWLFSFLNICQVLGIRPEYIRHALKRLRSTSVPPVKIRYSKQRSKRGTYRLAA